MRALQTWEQTGVFAPGPDQVSKTKYFSWPGQYGTVYWNEQPTTASVNLGGLRGVSDIAGTISTLATLAVFGLAIFGGYTGYQMARGRLVRKT